MNDSSKKIKTQLANRDNYSEIGFVDGNYEDKYNATNPISAYLMKGFLTKFMQLAHMFEKPRNIAEIGSGEGDLIALLIEMYPDATIDGCDLSDRVNDIARKKLSGFSQVTIKNENAEKVSYKDDSFDAVVCCEVLEHLNHPEKGIAELYRILRKGGYAIVSVPNEPIWRILNLARMKYIKDMGNTPGHFNHWTRRQFIQFVERAGFTVLKDNSPFPWSMLFLQK